MRCSFQASVSDYSNPRLCRIIDYNFISLSAPQFILPFLDHPFRFSLPPDLSPIVPHLVPVDATSLSLSLPASSPPLSPGRGAIVHLDGAHACRPPPLVCPFLPCRLWQPMEFVALSVPAFPYLVSLLAILYPCQDPCCPQVS